MTRLTPIERAIAGEPVDRRRRYDERKRREGFVRATLQVRASDIPMVKQIAALSREDPEAFADLVAAARSLSGGPERTERSEGAPRRPASRKAS